MEVDPGTSDFMDDENSVCDMSSLTKRSAVDVQLISELVAEGSYLADAEVPHVDSPPITPCISIQDGQELDTCDYLQSPGLEYSEDEPRHSRCGPLYLHNECILSCNDLAECSSSQGTDDKASHGVDSVQCGTDSEQRMDTSACAVFNRLDDIFRQRINMELENFASNLHEMLDDQRLCFKNITSMSSSDTYEEKQISLEKCNKQQLTAHDYFPSAVDSSWNRDSSSSSSETSLSNSSSQQGCVEESEEYIKSRCVIQLMTFATTLTNALRKQEYTTS